MAEQIIADTHSTREFINADTARTIRCALLIGLDCYGEIEKVHNQIGIRRLCGDEVPDELVPLHPTGSADTISDFASALRLIESIERSEIC